MYLTGDVDEVAERLVDVEGIELVLTAGEAAERFHLPVNRIGDLVLLGTEEAVFGPVDAGNHAEVELRSHGSHHENDVPYSTSANIDFATNFDAFSSTSLNHRPVSVSRFEPPLFGRLCVYARTSYSNRHLGGDQ